MIITSLCACPVLNQLHVISHPCSAQPSISLAYSVLILLVTSCFTFVFYFCCFTTTIIITTITSILSLLLISCCKQVLSGAVELTTQLSKLVRIFWLPLCRINKLGYLTREDCCDPLHLWVIKRGSLALL